MRNVLRFDLAIVAPRITRVYYYIYDTSVLCVPIGYVPTEIIIVISVLYTVTLCNIIADIY